jgi:hypothetical protein
VRITVVGGDHAASGFAHVSSVGSALWSPTRSDGSLRVWLLPAGVSDDTAEKPPMLVLLESLEFYRNVRIGAVSGALLAVALYLVRTLELLGPVVEVREYPAFGPDVWFLFLAFVLAATSALLVAITLTLFEAVRGARGVGRKKRG